MIRTMTGATFCACARNGRGMHRPVQQAAAQEGLIGGAIFGGAAGAIIGGAAGGGAGPRPERLSGRRQGQRSARRWNGDAPAITGTMAVAGGGMRGPIIIWCRAVSAADDHSIRRAKVFRIAACCLTIAIAPAQRRTLSFNRASAHLHENPGSCPRADDPAGVSSLAQNAPAAPKSLLENDQISVREIKLAPGATQPAVQRPNTFLYALTDGSIVFTPPGPQRL